MSDEKTIFVIGPVGSSDGPIYHESKLRLSAIFRPAAEANGMKAISSDELNSAGLITEDIINRLVKSELIIADLWPIYEGQPNPNVMYELGITHSYNTRVVTFMKQEQKLPFDVANVRSITWSGKGGDIESTKNKLAKLIESTINEDSDKISNPVNTAVKRRATIDQISEENPEKYMITEMYSMLLDLRKNSQKRTDINKTKSIISFDIYNQIFHAEQNLFSHFNSDEVNRTELANFLSVKAEYYDDNSFDPEYINNKIASVAPHVAQSILERSMYTDSSKLVAMSLAVIDSFVFNSYSFTYDEIEIIEKVKKQIFKR